MPGCMKTASLFVIASSPGRDPPIVADAQPQSHCKLLLPRFNLALRPTVHRAPSSRRLELNGIGPWSPPERPAPSSDHTKEILLTTLTSTATTSGPEAFLGCRQLPRRPQAVRPVPPALRAVHLHPTPQSRDGDARREGSDSCCLAPTTTDSPRLRLAALGSLNSWMTRAPKRFGRATLRSRGAHDDRKPNGQQPSGA